MQTFPNKKSAEPYRDSAVTRFLCLDIRGWEYANGRKRSPGGPHRKRIGIPVFLLSICEQTGRAALTCALCSTHACRLWFLSFSIHV